MTNRSRSSCVLLSVALLGCGTADAGTPAVAATDTAVATSAKRMPVHVDSVRPIEEEIARFRAAVGRGATRLERGLESRDALVAAFVAAVEAADTVALARLAIDAAEFIDLYYPHTQYTTKPYELSPELLWMLMTGNGEKGFIRILRRLAGQPLHVTGYTCGPPRVEGPNRLRDDCVLQRAGGDGPAWIRLFGSILERDGRFAFVSYANDL